VCRQLAQRNHRPTTGADGERDASRAEFPELGIERDGLRIWSTPLYRDGPQQTPTCSRSQWHREYAAVRRKVSR
jgi:hypothetical protein